jgi:succinate--hydroxymethylglutarate CoA-transferase
VDQATGLSSVGAIIAALYQREKNGKGMKIECSLLETQVYFNCNQFIENNYVQPFQLSLLSQVASSYLNAGWETERYGTAHASIVPYQAFTCQDNERIVVAAANDQFFKELCSVYNLNSSNQSTLFLI